VSSLVVDCDNWLPQHPAIAERHDTRPAFEARIGYEPRHQSGVQGANIPNGRPNVVGSRFGHDVLADGSHGRFPDCLERQQTWASQSSNADIAPVRFGSLADIFGFNRNVR
jgi:hypothetical protein